MILIDNILIDELIISTPFSCNVGECKGACCTIKGGEGAPLDISEIENLKVAHASALPYLSDSSKEFIAKNGFISGEDNDLSVSSIDNKDCVFVFYEDNGVAKCALERAYHDGKNTFRKPLSCHLFPIRIRKFGGDYLSFAPFEECSSAFDFGKQQQYVYESAKDALIRAYGEQWFSELDSYVHTSEGKS